tara:strand:+ start:1319 stop:2173 length:855 start_codon:yes stop_codon:yes gene_type:complete
MKTITTLLISASLLASQATATELTILNSGSKTGSFSMTSIAYYTDMLKSYDQINLVNPGTRCVAIGSLLPRIEGPVLMPWGSDYEASGRNGGCVTFDISKGQVLRYNKEPVSVCTMKPELNITSVSGKVAHTVPVDGPLSRVTGQINSSFNTNHENVTYDGSGAVRLALVNGEVDYALLSREHVTYVEQNGGSCDYNLTTGVNSLYNLDPTNPKLVFGFDNIWLALNMTKEEAATLKATLIEKHENCDSAIAKYTGCGMMPNMYFDMTDEEARAAWEPVVESQR